MASSGKSRWLGRAVCALALVSGRAAADEGQWTPEQIHELDQKRLEALGLEITPRELWNESGGLLRAAVNVAGCSGAFVSPKGLIITNHHCAYRAIQAQSTPEQDYLKLGFLARKTEQELPAKGYTIQTLKSIRDVSQEVLAAAAGKTDDAERQHAIELAQKRLVEACEKRNPALRCTVAGYYLGSRFELIETLELRDIRLVYAPALGVGEYGGDVDNWMWPRHTGDFALLRAYVARDGKSAEHAENNVPFVPQVHLKVSAGGVRPGELVAVMGYPARTNRYLPASEVKRQVDQVLPAVIDVYGEWLRLLAAAKARSKALAIKVAAQDKGFANRHKNARGMLDGIRRMGLVDRRAREEQKLVEWARGPERKRHAQALADLAALSDRRRQRFARAFLLEQCARGPNLLAVALDLVRRARERKKPDLDREDAYMDRAAVPLWKLQERRLRDFDPRVDAELLAALVTRAKQLPAAQRVAPLSALADSGQALEGRFRASKLANPTYAKQLFDAEPKAVLGATDPLLTLARALAPEIESDEAERDREAGLESRAGPLYFEMLRSVRGGAVYPDANGTLRLSFGTLKGYEPADGIEAKPQTTLRGALDKHTGEPPFALPQAVRDAASGAANSYWADTKLGDLPLCFLANLDTTGGNSGSAVINGKGELVGLNFDRVWENIAGDYGYSNARSRNINVDIRFMLWMLDRVDKAGALMVELGAAQFRSAPVRRSRAGVRRPSAGTPEDVAKSEPRAGCSCRLGPDPPGALLAILAGLALGVACCRRRMW